MTLTSLAKRGLVHDDGQVLEVQNSFLSDTYAKLRSVLVPGCQTLLTTKPGSSVVGVELSHGETSVKDLSLAIWKDATIQFKLDGSAGG